LRLAGHAEALLQRNGSGLKPAAMEWRTEREEIFYVLRSQDWVRQKSPNHPSSLRESGLKA
jgi:hypothetical protein